MDISVEDGRMHWWSDALIDLQVYLDLSDRASLSGNQRYIGQFCMWIFFHLCKIKNFQIEFNYHFLWIDRFIFWLQPSEFEVANPWRPTSVTIKLHTSVMAGYIWGCKLQSPTRMSVRVTFEVVNHEGRAYAYNVESHNPMSWAVGNLTNIISNSLAEGPEPIRMRDRRSASRWSIIANFRHHPAS